MAEDYSVYGDNELAALVRENRPDAFGELSARYLWLIRVRAAEFQGADAPEREDLLQEGFVGLYAAAVSFDETKGTSFRTYAGLCISRRMVDAARRHGSEKNRLLNESLSLDSEAAHTLSTETTPEDTVELREQFQGLLHKLELALTPLERKALSLYLSGCRRSEIEERSGMPLRTYDNAMFRVRSKVKAL